MQNPFIAASSSTHRDKNLVDNLRQLSDLETTPIFRYGLVLQVDREGGRFLIQRGSSGGSNDMRSVNGTCKVRLLTNLYNDTDGTSVAEIDIDDCYVLPLQHNRMHYPIAGEVVRIMFDRPFDRSANTVGYWLSKETQFANRDFTTNYKYREASHGKSVTHDEFAIYSGKRPNVIDNDYDIHPDYDLVFPEEYRSKEGDIVDQGQADTRIHHSFNAHSEGDKEGYIEIGTGYGYIGNRRNKEPDYVPFDDTSFNFDTATDDKVKQYQNMRLYHFKRFRDADRDSSRWEVLNSKTKVFAATKFNVDARLIHKDFEKDGTGDFGNVQGFYDKNYRDEGPGPNCGQEIEQAQIHDKIDIDSSAQQGDVLEVQSNTRNAISFDEAKATIMLQADQLRMIASDSTRAINHGVLGEEQLRWLQRMMIIMLHVVRTCDILNDRIHRLGEDMINHIHLIKPGSSTAPLGSPAPPVGKPLKEFLYYVDTTDGEVGGDSSFEEKGSDSPSMKIKDRIKEERKQIEQLIKELPDNLSDSFALN